MIQHTDVATNQPAVCARNLTKSYQRGDTQFNALDSLNLTVARGEFVAIMGASGSGKSTALHLLAGLTRPTSGSALIEGRELFQMSDRDLTVFRRRRIGTVFQSYNLIPCLTVRENILFPLRADKRKLDAQTLDKLASFWARIELTEQLDQYPDALSGGQQQRVALARALAAEPAVVLADEPTGNLDWTGSRAVCEIFDQLNREEGRTIVLVTHEPSAAIWSKRVVILRDGKLVEDVATSEFNDAGELAAHYQDLARQAQGKERA
ncbi:MAG: ABC transporter ATP-binding protein [Planctomycetia bacterium]|nr:ABC transporter ATP-binding protein [Planctomycetia bacterium]